MHGKRASYFLFSYKVFFVLPSHDVISFEHYDVCKVGLVHVEV